jgi:hypothetical protein
MFSGSTTVHLPANKTFYLVLRCLFCIEKNVFFTRTRTGFFYVRKIRTTSEANPLVSSDFSDGLKKLKKREFILVSYSTSAETNMDDTATVIMCIHRWVQPQLL